MKRILFDVNVLLDVMLDRKPFAETAAAVWGEVEDGFAEGLLSAHAVTTLHYLNARAVGPAMAAETTESILSVFTIAAVDQRVLARAAHLQWNDFEDAVTAAAAAEAQCDAVVTRNAQDFGNAPVRVLTPAEAIAWLRVGREPGR